MQERVSPSLSIVAMISTLPLGLSCSRAFSLHETSATPAISSILVILLEIIKMYFCQVTINPLTPLLRHARPLPLRHAPLPFRHARPLPLRHARPDRASPANQSASSRTRSPVKPGMTMEVKMGMTKGVNPRITSLIPSQAPYVSSRVQANAFCHPERSRRPTFFVIPSRNPSCHLERSHEQKPLLSSRAEAEGRSREIYPKSHATTPQSQKDRPRPSPNLS